MIKVRLSLLFFAFILMANTSKSQLSGTYSVPANYPTIAAAINDLNTLGISGPVTILVNAGHTETAPVGGFSMTATGTSANPIIFQKNGAGANPLITAYTGTATPVTTTIQDGVWRLIGSDYVTIDGIDITDPNTTNPATMEFGYGLFKASATNGCQNNTITNCVITLNKVNNAAGTGVAVDGSRGIDMVNSLSGAHTAALTITSVAGSNSNNKFYANTIQNCNIGIALIGYAAPSPFSLADTGNYVGGNSVGTGNTIINYGGGATTSPAAAVRTLAQYSVNVSYNIINNNNGAGVNHATTLRGIYLNTATSANASVTNNTITLKFTGTTAAHTGIENASGSTAANNTITINNNVFTGCDHTSTSGIFSAIYNTASCAYLNVSNNTFTNNATNPTTGSTYLIRNTGAVTQQIDINNNNFSHNFPGTALTSADIYNIYSSATGTTQTINYLNNNFLSYTSNMTGTGDIYFINSSRDAVNLNIIGNNASNLTLKHSGIEYIWYNPASVSGALTVASNTINNIVRNGAIGTTYCYYSAATSAATGVQTFSNNIVSNITATVSGSGTFYGWYNSAGGSAPYPKKNIFNNVLSNINVNTTGTFYGIYTDDIGDGVTTSGSSIYNNLVDNITSSGVIYGLYNASPTSTNYITNVYTNTVSNITGNGASAAVYGSYVGSGTAGINFYKNRIHDITTNGATGTSYGIYAVTSPTSNIFNNLVGNIFAPSSGGANRANGIFAASGTNLNFYYNTVYLSGTSSGTDFGTNAIYTATTITNVTMRNNIFVNLSTPTGTGTAVAYRRNGVSTANYNLASNDNLFYAGTPGANNLIFTDGTNNYSALSTYISAFAPADASSITENPAFVSTVGSNANFLNINTVTPTQIESSGAAIAGILDDYIGTVRSATPDIGAWEGNYTLAQDNNAPTFLQDGFTTSACNLTSRTYTINMVDVSGVASGSLAPRVYYSINGGPYTSVSGTLTSGAAINGVWTFNLTYAGNPLDVISYYVVAQDIAATANVGALPGGGFTAVDVNNITTPPTTPFTYTLSATLNGTYTVGTAGNFTTFTQAANVYNSACLTGPVTYVLTDPSYSTNETFPVIFTNNPDASSTNSLLIIPAVANSATITTGTTFTNTTVKFLNARFITMDGLNTGGSALTVANTWTTTNSAAIWLASTPTTGPGNNTIGLKRMSIVGPPTTSTARYGILATADAANPVVTTGPDNDNVTIESNTITSTYYGIYAAANASVTAGGFNNWLVDGNQIGNSTSNIGFRGMYFTGAPGIVITNNSVQNIFPGASGASGIYLNSGINGASVAQNTITNITCTVAASGTGAANGIYMGSNIINTTVEKNTISNILNTTSTGYAGRGIIINTSTNTPNYVRNNMISEIYGTGDNTALYWPIGIALEGTSGGINIENNTVNLASSYAGLTTATVSAALYVNTTGANNVVRNNILCNTYDNTSITTDVAYAVYSSAATSANIATMNYNDYYVGGTGNTPVMGYVASTQQMNLAAMQASFGGNLNSQNVLPVFVSPTDLHLQSVLANGPIDNTGTPVAGITVDIDNQVRNVTTPDIGADEFSTPSCTAAVGGTITSASVNLCNGQSLSITSNSVSVGSTSSYQWMSSSTPGGPYTPVVGGSGANTTSYNSPALSTGTLYFVLEVGCSAVSQTMTSNEATVVINPIPTASISPNSTICAGQTLSLTGSSDIGTNFIWSGPNAFASTSQNPTISNITSAATGNYSLVVSANSCSAAMVTSSVTVNSVALNITSPAVGCVGSSYTLNAVGPVVSYTWNTSANTSSIVVAPTVTSIYSVAATGTNNCIGTSIVTITAVNPTITGIGAVSCGIPSTSTLSAIAFTPSTVNWYQTLTSTVSLGTGTNYIPAAASTNTTIYVEADGAGKDSVTTVMNGSLQFPNQMFDIVAQNPIEITGFDANFNGTGASTIEIWTRPGSFIGFETSSTGWTLLTTATAQALGVGNLAQIQASLSVNVAAGQTQAFYLAVIAGTNFRYSTGTSLGAVWASNSDLQLLQGKSSNTYFSVTTSPRAFNGKVKYNKSGCVSPRIPVTLTVTPNPTVTASASSATICAGNTTTLTAGGATTYTWNTTATTTVISVNPSSTTIYTVTGEAAGCTGTETVAVNVTALPSLTLTAAQTTVCTNGPTVTLTGSPAGGSYSGTNVSGNAFTPGATAGTFTPVYSYTSPVTGCSNTVAVSIDVSTCIGLAKNSALQGLEVYPNPTAGEITIELNNGMDKTVEVTDLTGRIIFTTKTTKDKLNVSLNEFSNGVYFVKIQSNDRVEIIKVVKQ